MVSRRGRNVGLKGQKRYSHPVVRQGALIAPSLNNNAGTGICPHFRSPAAPGRSFWEEVSLALYAVKTVPMALVSGARKASRRTAEGADITGVIKIIIKFDKITTYVC